MIKKIITTFLIFLSWNSFAIVVTDEYLSTLESNWLSLAPADAYDFIPEDLSYEVYNSADFQAKLEAAGSKLNNSLDGKDIALAGFMVPIEYIGSNVSKFLLVPESGQCIHVPPPPLNQTLLVDVSNEPTKFRDLYIPIIVYGRISVGSQSFDIADSGYTISDAVIEPLHFSDEDYNNLEKNND
ncbi:MAG: hypothetical protein ACI9GY_000791 [Brevundimonas sp.]|jgi:hypothetical protein|tara:strand:+ start:2497 stop:3048 length:552 start_codon:yes stop_codon:yes gene_type:complete